MSAQTTLNNTARVEKRMRKGTRSCLSCRQRKARCIFPTEEGAPCVECASRSLPCQPQGVVEGRGERTTRRLMQRITTLEEQLRQANEQAHRSAGKPPSDIDDRLNDAVAALQQLRSLPTRTTGVGTASGATSCDNEDDDHHESDEYEEQINSTTAPLLTALNGSRMVSPAILGTERSPQPRDILTFNAQGTDHKSAAHTPKDLTAIRDLSAALPDEADMLEIFAQHSSWWPLYRETLGLDWGDDSSNNGNGPVSFPAFAARALADGHPTSLALLLTCFAIATGDRPRFLAPVERYIVHDHAYASTQNGLACLMALGLCYLAALQPRRAWVVYRQANTLLQLNGMHLAHARSFKSDSLFWQLHHADRWCSLMIGLPYMVPDQFCDVAIGSVQELGPGTWLYRHLALITGRIIDYVQSTQRGSGVRLSTALEIEERLDALKSDLPAQYLNLQQIQLGKHSLGERRTRLYRLVHFHQLRAYIHLPFLLRASSTATHSTLPHSRQAYSRETCLADCRALLDAYLALYVTDPRATSDGTVINFTAFTAAVVLLLCIIRRPPPASKSAANESLTPYDSNGDDRRDGDLVERVLHALEFGAQRKISAALCRRCHAALQALATIARGSNTTDSGSGTTDARKGILQRIIIPYFGTVAISTGEANGPGQATDAASSGLPATRPSDHSGSSVQVHGEASLRDDDIRGQPPSSQPDLTAPYDFSMDFTYEGPWLPETQNHISDLWGAESHAAFFDPAVYAGENEMFAFDPAGADAAAEFNPSWSYADLPPM